jgi:hypothetical protein
MNTDARFKRPQMSRDGATTGKRGQRNKRLEALTR